MALLFIGNRGALYYKDKMSEKKLWYKIEDSLYDEEEEEDFRRIRSHVKNEIEEKYKQLEFEFDEDLVAPI